MSKKLRFYPGTHTYWIGRTKLESVTTFVDRFFAPFNEKEIARKLAKIPDNKKAGRGVRWFLNEWKKSREYGSLVHNQIEEYINNEDPSKLSDYDTKALVGIDHYNLVWARIMDDCEVKPELQVYDEELGLAGTIDVFIKTVNNDVYLVDWKTNKSISTSGYKGKKGILPPTASLDDCKLVKYSLQLALYAYILERSGLNIKQLFLVHLGNSSANEFEIDYEEYKPIVLEMLKYVEENKDE